MPKENEEVEVDPSDLEVLAEGSNDKETEETPKEVEAKGEEESETKVEDAEVEEEDLEAKADEKLLEDTEVEEAQDTSGYIRPSVTEIKAKYPTFFKEFPAVQKALFIAKEYADEFESIDAARDSKEKSETLDRIQTEIVAGNAENFISAIKEFDSKATEKFVNNFIPHLMKVDKDLYFQAITPIVQRFVQGMYGKGKKTGDENLANAALVALQHAGFSEEDLNIREERSDPKLQEREAELTRREQGLEQQRFVSAANEVDSECHKALSEEIDELIKGEKCTPYEKKGMKEDILKTFNKAIVKDAEHMKLMTQLWEKAKKAGYNREWRERISDAYLSRAKRLLPVVRNKVRAEMLGTTKVSKVSEKVVEKKSERTPQQQTQNNRRPKFKSDMDILMDGA